MQPCWTGGGRGERQSLLDIPHGDVNPDAFGQRKRVGNVRKLCTGSATEIQDTQQAVGRQQALECRYEGLPPLGGCGKAVISELDGVHNWMLLTRDRRLRCS